MNGKQFTIEKIIAVLKDLSAAFPVFVTTKSTGMSLTLPPGLSLTLL